MKSFLAKPIANTESWLLELIQSYAQRIVVLGYVRELYIFGSFVRNEFTEGSDLDFLVVVENSPDVKTFYREFSSKGLGWPADILVLTEESFQRKKMLGGVCQEVFEKGRLLFAR